MGENIKGDPSSSLQHWFPLPEFSLSRDEDDQSLAIYVVPTLIINSKFHLTPNMVD